MKGAVAQILEWDRFSHQPEPETSSVASFPLDTPTRTTTTRETTTTTRKETISTTTKYNYFNPGDRCSHQFWGALPGEIILSISNFLVHCQIFSMKWIPQNCIPIKQMWVTVFLDVSFSRSVLISADAENSSLKSFCVCPLCPLWSSRIITNATTTTIITS